MINLNNVVYVAMATHVGSRNLTSAHQFKVATAQDLVLLGKGAVRALKRYFTLQEMYAPAQVTAMLAHYKLTSQECISGLAALEKEAMNSPTYPIDRDPLHFVPDDIRSDVPFELFVFDEGINDWHGANFITMQSTQDPFNPDVVVTFFGTDRTETHSLKSPGIITIHEFRETFVMPESFPDMWVKASVPPMFRTNKVVASLHQLRITSSD